MLLEVLQWNALHKAPQPGSGQQSEVLLQLRVSKASMRTMQFQEEVINQVCRSLCPPWYARRCDPGCVWVLCLNPDR